MSFARAFGWLAMSLAVISIAACRSEKVSEPTDAKPVASASGHTHEGWWCDEHGVPEEECAQCNVKLVAAFKQKGDWCEKHNRPSSHCFICHPEKQGEYAALYEAKYGKQPPKPEADGEHGEEKAKS